MDVLHTIQKIPLFSGLSRRNLKLIHSFTVKRKFRKGSIIFTENTSGKNLYIVLSGHVKIYIGISKRKKTLTYLDPGDFFGELALLGKHIRTASSKAISDCELLILNQRDFLNILRRYPDITLNLLKELSQRLRGADREIGSLSFNSVTGRVAKVILELSRKYGKKTQEGTELVMNFDKKEIAELAGTVREVATRAINQLCSVSYIRYKNRHIIITEESKLRSLIQ